MFLSSKNRSAVCLFALMSCVACSAGSTDDDSLTETASTSADDQALIAGHVSWGAPDVVAITDAKLITLCTGTLVARNMVLTVAHCSKSNPPPKYVWIYKGGGAVADIKEVAVAYYNKQWEFDGKTYVHDVGLLKLKTLVAPSVAKARAMSPDSPPNGTHMTQWGFGPRGTKRYIDFYWPDHTEAGEDGDSGGPVIRGDKGLITRVHVGYDVTNANDVSAPLNANWGWIQSAMRAHAIY